MWNQLVALFRAKSACHAAFEESIHMLEASRGMFFDAVDAMHGRSPLVAEIFERDRQINKAERSVRRKILEHLKVAPRPDVDTALVLAAIAVDIERIGDYTKNIAELTQAVDSRLDAGVLTPQIHTLEERVGRMFDDSIPALECNDVARARAIIDNHEYVNPQCERLLDDLRRGRVLTESSAAAVVTALYLRYIKRVSAHLKNVATSVVNPYPRIGFREKNQLPA